MFRFALALVAICLFSDVGRAQLFPNAPWNRGSATARFSNDACPGGVCPVPSQGRGVLRPNVNVNVNTSPSLVEEHNAQHNGYYGGPQWTWPGDLQTHLATAHNVAPAPQYTQSSYAVPPQAIYVPQSGGSTGSVRSGGSTGSAAVRSGGSTGSLFYVGKTDACGNVITSIGSTVSPEISKAGSGTIEALGIGDRVKFRRSLLAAARQARETGDITPAQFFLLSAASRNPGTLDKMQAAVHEAAIEEGLATTQAVDWDQLISFIEKLIPIIIQLIDLFSYNQVHGHQSFEVTGFDPYTLAA